MVSLNSIMHFKSTYCHIILTLTGRLRCSPLPSHVTVSRVDPCDLVTMATDVGGAGLEGGRLVQHRQVGWQGTDLLTVCRA